MDQPTFGERIQALKNIANQLRSFAETILLEAQHMEAIQSRFQERMSNRTRNGKSRQN